MRCGFQGNRRSSRRERAERALRILAGLALVALPRPAAAATVTVDCSGGTPGAFTSISAALNSLTTPPPVNDWHYVLLKGNCTENVTVTGGRRVWIAPEGSSCPYSGCPSGPPARIAAALPGAPAVDVSGPGDVTLVNVVVSGGSNGVRAIGNANVTLYGVIAEDNGGAGIQAEKGAMVDIFEGAARRNGYYGVLVGNGSGAFLSGQLSWLRNQPLVISANRGGGVRADRSLLGGYSGITVEDNLGPGMAAYGADILWGAYVAETLIQNNQGGVFLSEASQASFWRSQTGITTFRNNGSYGVYVEKGSHASIFDALVEGHTGVGVDAVMNSQVSLQGTLIRGNGSLANLGSAGVRVDGNSEAFIDGAEVTGSNGPGLVVDLNSSADVRSVVITGGAAEAIRLRTGSFATLGTQGSITPNSGAPVTCDATSYIVHNLLPRSPICGNVIRPTQPRPVRPPVL